MNGSTKNSSTERFAVCVNNHGYLASLDLHKVYRVLPDEVAARDGDLRIIDESGEEGPREASPWLRASGR